MSGMTAGNDRFACTGLFGTSYHKAGPCKGNFFLSREAMKGQRGPSTRALRIESERALRRNSEAEHRELQERRRRDYACSRVEQAAKRRETAGVPLAARLAGFPGSRPCGVWGKPQRPHPKRPKKAVRERANPDGLSCIAGSCWALEKQPINAGFFLYHKPSGARKFHEI